jgi:DNA-binding protein
MFSLTDSNSKLKLGLLLILIPLAGAPAAHASECVWADVLTLGVSCIVKQAAKTVAKSEGRGLIEGVKPEFEKMVDRASQQLIERIETMDWHQIGQQLGESASQEVLNALNSIDWEDYGQQVGAGLSRELETTMNRLFDQQLKPLLKDIDMLLKGRIEQADQAAAARLAQLDQLIDDKLAKVDDLIQDTVAQFNQLADDTITKIRRDIIDYAVTRFETSRDETVRQIQTDVIDYGVEQFETSRDETVSQIQADVIDYGVEQFETSRDETVSQIQADVIDYAANTFKQTTQEMVASVKVDLIDQTFAQLHQVRSEFRQDVDHFFDRTENLLVLLDCTEEKIRLDLERTREQLDKLGEKYLKEFKQSFSGVSRLMSFGQKKAKPEESTQSTTIDTRCYEQLGIDAESLEGFEYSTIYDIKKCKVLSTLTSDTPLRRVQNVYLDLHVFAKRVACIQRNPNHFLWDWLMFEQLYDFWSMYQY